MTREAFEVKHITVSLMFLLMLITLSISPTAYSRQTSERADLEQIQKELIYLEEFIIKARNKNEHTARIRFRYDWLINDIKTVQHGIKAHLDAPIIQPKVIKPLKGDYRDFSMRADT